MVRVLLANRTRFWPEARSRRPILVVCFTNRALDSFLESTLQVTKKVVRIGGRSKSELLESHNLSSVKKWTRASGLKDSSFYKLEKSLEKELFDLRTEATELSRKLTSSNDPDLFEKLLETVRKMSETSNRLEDIRQMESASVVANADVVGLTTSGAAKYRHLVRMIDPKVVIVEEAGQVGTFVADFDQLASRDQTHYRNA